MQADGQDKLTPITGIAPQYQVIRVYRSSESNDLVADLSDDSLTLESYGMQEWNLVKVSSLDQLGQWS